jgi:NADPH:quinone reductase-like Zn-dependent oxidoreductase
MKYADMVGLEKILADIHEFAKQDPLFWQASPLLEQLVKDGKITPIPVHKHPLADADKVLTSLRQGKVTGRAVLTA